MNGAARLMRPLAHPLAAFVAGLLSVLSAPHAANAQQHYTITDLGTLGGTISLAWGINDSGQVVGWSQPAEGADALPFLYSGGVMSVLGTLPGGNGGFAFGINNSGDVVGFADGMANGTPFYSHAFRYHDGAMMNLGTLGGDFSLAYGINERGDTVGASEFTIGPNNDQHAFLYHASDGTMQDLGALGGSYSVAYSVNASDSVVGYYIAGEFGPYRSFLYQDGVMSDLDTLGTLGGSFTFAYDINDAGQVVGQTDVDKTTRAFLYENGVMHDLGTLPGGNSAGAQAINEAGAVVGNSDTSTPGVSHAVLWQHGTTVDLDAAIDQKQGWTQLSPFDINLKGQIVGSGMINGETHGFLLTPGITAGAPEPDTGALLLGLSPLLLGGVVFCRRGRSISVKKQGETA